MRIAIGRLMEAMWAVETPGPRTANLERLTWTRVTRPLFPSDDDFEPGIRAVTGREHRR